MSNKLYSKSFPSTTEAIGVVLNEALDVLEKNGWCPSPTANFSLRLCLEEALVNAMVHGNESNSGAEVRLEITDRGDTCAMAVWDGGTGFDPQEIDMPECEQLGGRGVCLIKHMMHDLRYDRDNSCLEMTFRRDTFERKEETNAKKSNAPA